MGWNGWVNEVPREPERFTLPILPAFGGLGNLAAKGLGIDPADNECVCRVGTTVSDHDERNGGKVRGVMNEVAEEGGVGTLTLFAAVADCWVFIGLKTKGVFAP